MFFHQEIWRGQLLGIFVPLLFALHVFKLSSESSFWAHIHWGIQQEQPCFHVLLFMARNFQCILPFTPPIDLLSHQWVLQLTQNYSCCAAFYIQTVLLMGTACLIDKICLLPELHLEFSSVLLHLQMQIQFNWAMSHLSFPNYKGEKLNK